MNGNETVRNQTEEEQEITDEDWLWYAEHSGPDGLTAEPEPLRTEPKRDLPRELTEEGLFCIWKEEERNGKRLRIPYDPITRRQIKSTNREGYATYARAGLCSDCDGIGVGLFNGVCAIVVRDCVTDSGYFTEPAAKIISLMQSYAEYTPGGDSIAVLFQARDFLFDPAQYEARKGNLSVYAVGTGGFVPVTGRPCGAYDFGDRTPEFGIFLERYMRREENRGLNGLNGLNSDGAAGTEENRGLNGLNGLNSDGAAGAEENRGLNGLNGLNSDGAAGAEENCGLNGLNSDGAAGTEENRGLNGLNGLNSPAAAGEGKSGTGQPAFPQVVPLTPKSGVLPHFPVDDLPGAVRNYVRAAAEQTQTAPDMAAVIGLGVLAVCLQGKFRIEGRPGYTEPLSLYVVVTAPPGERKSGVMRAMTAPLYEYEQEYNRAHADKIRANRRERERLERQIAGLKKKLETRIDREAELELQHLEHQLEDLPELHPARYFADDCSSEALTRLMTANGGVLSVISTEGGIFDILGGRYSARANLDVWLKGHCGDAIYVDRIGREAECIPNPTLSAILTIQPSVLNEIMEDTTMTGRGLIARFLYATPESAIGGRRFRSEPVPPAVQQAYHDLIFRLMAIPLPEKPGTLTLSAEALDMISDHFDEHERWLAGEGQMIADWAGKYIGAVLRIAGLLHAAEADPAKSVPADTMRRAIRIGRYFLAHAGYAYSVMGSDQNMRKAKFVLAKLQSLGESEVKRNDLFRLCRGKFFRKAEDLVPTLELLEEHGYLKQLQPERKGAGRPEAVRILLNPAAKGV